MDLSLAPEQIELRSLARQVLTDRCQPEQLAKVAATESATDLDLWRTLADAGLVGIGLPESVGGGGYGWLEAAVVLSELGRSVAPVPGLAVMALAAPALAARPDLLDGVASGSIIVTAAIHEPNADPWAPTTAVTEGRLTGTKICVPHGLLASRFVVTAADGLYAIEADADGVAIERQDTTSGVPDAQVTLEGAPGERIGDRDAVADVLRHGASGAAVMVAGITDAVLGLTAAYATSRHQFGKPIAAFQSVSQRVGDTYIDNEAIRLSAWQAAWRLAEGLPADEAILTAKFWAAEGGWRAVHAAQHVHGGVGVDRDYPLHRYFLAHKQFELQLGSATPTLLHLGRLLAG